MEKLFKDPSIAQAAEDGGLFFSKSSAVDGAESREGYSAASL